MRALNYTARFRKDLKRERKTDPSVETLLRKLISLLVEGKELPQKLKDHPLVGEWRDHRDCHLKPDLVLIYKVDEAEVTLVRLGSHSELF
jgi:mRNA interferase YafQ